MSIFCKGLESCECVVLFWRWLAASVELPGANHAWRAWSSSSSLKWLLPCTGEKKECHWLPQSTWHGLPLSTCRKTGGIWLGDLFFKVDVKWTVLWGSKGCDQKEHEVQMTAGCKHHPQGSGLGPVQSNDLHGGMECVDGVLRQHLPLILNWGWGVVYDLSAAQKRDFYGLEKWTIRKLMKFNKGKWQVPSVGPFGDTGWDNCIGSSLEEELHYAFREYR